MSTLETLEAKEVINGEFKDKGLTILGAVMPRDRLGKGLVCLLLPLRPLGFALHVRRHKRGTAVISVVVSFPCRLSELHAGCERD